MNKFILGCLIISVSLNVVHLISLRQIIKGNEITVRSIMEFHAEKREEFQELQADWRACENAIATVFEINEALILLREKNDEFWRRWHNGTFKIPKLIDSARDRKNVFEMGAPWREHLRSPDNILEGIK